MKVLLVGRNLTSAAIGKKLVDAGYLVDLIANDFTDARELSYSMQNSSNPTIIILPYEERFFGIPDNGSILHTFENKKDSSEYMSPDSAILSDENVWTSEPNSTVIVADYWKAELYLQKLANTYELFVNGRVVSLEIFDEYCIAFIKDNANSSYKKKIYDLVIWTEYPDDLLHSYGFRDIFLEGTPNFGGSLIMYSEEKVDRDDFAQTYFMNTNLVKKMSLFPNPESKALVYCETLHAENFQMQSQMERIKSIAEKFFDKKFEIINYNLLRGQCYRGVVREYIKVFDNKKSFKLFGPYARDFEADAFSEIVAGELEAEAIIKEYGEYN